MTGNLFLAKYLASTVKKCENHSLIIAVDHKTCSVRMNFNLKFMHLSMPSWRGIGQDFDRSLWLGGRAFELCCSPGGRDI